MNKKDLDNLVHLLNTQDNRATQDPIYVAEEEEIIYGVSLSYTDETVWLDKRRNSEDGGYVHNLRKSQTVSHRDRMLT